MFFSDRISYFWYKKLDHKFREVSVYGAGKGWNRAQGGCCLGKSWRTLGLRRRTGTTWFGVPQEHCHVSNTMRGVKDLLQIIEGIPVCRLTTVSVLSLGPNRLRFCPKEIEQKTGLPKETTRSWIVDSSRCRYEHYRYKQGRVFGIGWTRSYKWWFELRTLQRVGGRTSLSRKETGDEYTTKSQSELNSQTPTTEGWVH